jgi:hypothetical protein
MASFSKKSIDFDGSNDHVVMSDVLDFDHNEPFSVSCWFRTADNNGYLASKIDGAIRGWGIHLDPSGSFQFVFLTSSVVGVQVATTATGFDDNRWHHAVATYSGNGLASGVTLYVDGSLEAKAAPVFDNLAAGTTVNAQALQINGRTGTSVLITTHMDDVAIFDKELSGPEVAELYNSSNPLDARLSSMSSSLVGYWTMGDGDTFPTLRDRQVATPILAAGTIKDRSTNTNDGTPANMEDVDFTTDTPGGISGFSSLFDGVDEYISLGNISALNFERTDAFSVSAWIKTSDITQHGSVVSKFFTEGWFFSLNSSELNMALWVTGGNRISVSSSSAPLANNTWAHVCGTYDGSNTAAGINIYVNGSATGLTVNADTLVSNIANTYDVRIGGRADPGVYFDGYIDDVSVYDAELSLAQIQEIYNSGSPTDNTLLKTESSLVGYWLMGEDANDGTMTNMTSGDILLESAAGVGGCVHDFDGYFGCAEEDRSVADGCVYVLTSGATIGVGAADVTYLMRAIDDGAPGLYYHYWLVTGDPDPTGAQTTAPFGGPLSDIVVAGTYTP